MCIARECAPSGLELRLVLPPRGGGSEVLERKDVVRVGEGQGLREGEGVAMSGPRGAVAFKYELSIRRIAQGLREGGRGKCTSTSVRPAKLAADPPVVSIILT